MESVWVLCGRVVAPDSHVSDLVDMATSLFSKLAYSSALIKSGKGRELRLGDRGGVVGADKCVGVSRVTDNNDLDALLGDLVDGLALGLENLGVSLKQIRALHAGTSGPGTNKNGNISIFEANKRISSGNNLLNARVSAVVELHD